MVHRDANVPNVILMIRDPYANDLDSVAATLKSMGVEVVAINRNKGTIEVTAPLSLILQVHDLPPVKAVRVDFCDVTADPNPRNTSAPGSPA